MRRRTDYMMSPDNEDCLIDGSRKQRSSIHSVPTLVAFGLIAVLLGLFGLVYTIDNSLPTALERKDEGSHPDAFITERARQHLKFLTDLGPRIVGSYENELLTVDYLKREINNIILKAHKNQKIELDIQVVTGAFYLDQMPNGKIVPYTNLQNVVVKLHGGNNSSSLLINAHFDSVPTSPGGSDDGISCAIMLEVLRIMGNDAQRPRNNIVFLFNGAEETGLQAGHGFITQHKWAGNCKVVMNLEAAGHGGKMILFQTGPNAPWLLEYYDKVPYPYAQAAGEEIFQSGIIPSDTDFRIFRDFGGLVGLDMAFMKNGYRYHTKFDDFDHLPPGSFQQAGSNALSLARNLANAPEVSNPTANPGKMVFFDVFGFFMISYSHTVAQIINYLVVVLSVVSFGLSIHTFKFGYTKQTLKYLVLSFSAIIVGWIAAAAFVAVFALIIDKFGFCMSWYANPWLIFGMFVAPGIGISASLLPFVTQKNLTDNIRSQVQAHAVRMIWTGILFLGTVLKIRAMYALLIPVFFNTLAFLLINAFKLQHSVRKWQIIYAVSLVIPTMFLMYTASVTLALFVPITGRIGPDKNADLIIGAMSLLFTILVTSPFVAISTLVRKFKYVQTFLIIIFISSVIIIVTPLGFPYSGNPNSPAPERYWMLHSRRIFHSENGTEIKRDSGYFLLNMDRNSPNKVKPFVPDIARARSMLDDCEEYLVCGLPLIHAKAVQIIPYSTWIPAGPPIFSEPVTLTVNSATQISPTIKRYNISILGPDRIGLYMSPKENLKILNISLIEKMPINKSFWNGRELYIILSIWGKKQEPLNFAFDVEVPANFNGTTTEIAISGIYVHDNLNRKVPHFTQFLKRFPDWADVTAWLGSYENFWI